MGYGDWSSYIFQGAPQAKPKTRRLHRQKKIKNSVWSLHFKKLIVLMISQADLEDLWIRLRGSGALQWQMAACLLPPGNVLKCLQWKVLKVDLIWVGIQASMRFIWTLFSHVMQEQRREQDLGRRLDFLLSSSLVSELRFCATSTSCLTSGPQQQHRGKDE